MTSMPRVTFSRVVRSEWTKLRSLRSTWVVLGAVALLVVGLAGAVGWGNSRQAEPPSAEEAVGGAFLAVDGLALVLGVFGVLLMTGEYGSGLIRATLAAVPRRLPVLVAKALVLVSATLPVTTAVCFASFLINQAFIDAAYRLTLADPGVLRTTLGAAAAPVGFALLGLGAGAILRHTAGAITAYVAALLVIPVLLPAALPDSIEDDILPYTPISAGQAMYEFGESTMFPWMLPPGTGALVLAGWVVLLLAGGATVLRRRDA
jgi:hypothetical protein